MMTLILPFGHPTPIRVVWRKFIEIQVLDTQNRYFFRMLRKKIYKGSFISFQLVLDTSYSDFRPILQPKIYADQKTQIFIE